MSGAAAFLSSFAGGGASSGVGGGDFVGTGDVNIAAPNRARAGRQISPVALGAAVLAVVALVAVMRKG